MIDPVPSYERVKAEFVTEYRALCVEYGAMVIAVQKGDCEMYVVGVTRELPSALDQQIAEMMLEIPLVIRGSK